MRTSLVLGLIVAAYLSTGMVVRSQQSFELPTYTDTQRWNRAVALMIASRVSDLAQKKATGMSPEDAGREGAKVFGPPNGWVNLKTPFALFRTYYFNSMSHPMLKCELLEATGTLVRARCNRPHVGYFGASGRRYGVTVGEYEASGRSFMRAIADYHGIDWEQVSDVDGVNYTIRTRESDATSEPRAGQPTRQ